MKGLSQKDSCKLYSFLLCLWLSWPDRPLALPLWKGLQPLSPDPDLVDERERKRARNSTRTSFTCTHSSTRHGHASCNKDKRQGQTDRQTHVCRLCAQKKVWSVCLHLSETGTCAWHLFIRSWWRCREGHATKKPVT